MKSKYNRRRTHKPAQPGSNQPPTLEQRALEVVRDRLRIYVDKYATIEGGVVKYSLYDHKTRTATKKQVDMVECVRIYGELYA